DAGANLVIGHHPHVVQEVEEYRGGTIAYSLGNFVFDQNFSDETRGGLVLEVEVKNGEVVRVSEHRIFMNESYQPELVTGN
ncbi:CapA family protein, partial [Candidatus Uhrbacteria bacterium]|nr:CapA family protein [Candidatus Uhrbacteria bacterium]